MSNALLDSHEASAVVLGCMDFRFHPFLALLLQEAFGIHHDAYDLVLFDGGARNVTPGENPERRRATLEAIALAVEAHHVQRIVLLNHQQCGKYAKAGHTFTEFTVERAFHQNELREAQKIVREHFPNTSVLLGFLWIDDENTIRLEKVE